MNDQVSIEIQGIKCDAEGCDYNDMTVPVTDYPQYVNKPCPKCGANLLTEADFAFIQRFGEMVEEVNANFGEMVAGVSMSEGDGTVVTEISLDGTGIPKIKNISHLKDETHD